MTDTKPDNDPVVKELRELAEAILSKKAAVEMTKRDACLRADAEISALMTVWAAVDQRIDTRLQRLRNP